MSQPLPFCFALFLLTLTACHTTPHPPGTRASVQDPSHPLTYPAWLVAVKPMDHRVAAGGFNASHFWAITIAPGGGEVGQLIADRGVLRGEAPSDTGDVVSAEFEARLPDGSRLTDESAGGKDATEVVSLWIGTPPDTIGESLAGLVQPVPGGSLVGLRLRAWRSAGSASATIFDNEEPSREANDLIYDITLRGDEVTAF